jgi:hypothetical protein
MGLVFAIDSARVSPTLAAFLALEIEAYSPTLSIASLTRDYQLSSARASWDWSGHVSGQISGVFFRLELGESARISLALGAI